MSSGIPLSCVGRAAAYVRAAQLAARALDIVAHLAAARHRYVQVLQFVLERAHFAFIRRAQIAFGHVV